jgi:hypothetical protein
MKKIKKSTKLVMSYITMTIRAIRLLPFALLKHRTYKGLYNGEYDEFNIREYNYADKTYSENYYFTEHWREVNILRRWSIIRISRRIDC